MTVDSYGKLTLNAATITSGTVTNGGTIDLTGSAVLKQGTLNDDHRQDHCVRHRQYARR